MSEFNVACGSSMIVSGDDHSSTRPDTFSGSDGSTPLLRRRSKHGQYMPGPRLN